jgi:hypothetical protein
MNRTKWMVWGLAVVLAGSTMVVLGDLLLNPLRISRRTTFTSHPQRRETVRVEGKRTVTSSASAAYGAAAMAVLALSQGMEPGRVTVGSDEAEHWPTNYPVSQPGVSGPPPTGALQCDAVLLLAFDMAAHLGAEMSPGESATAAESKAAFERHRRDHWKRVMQAVGDPAAAGAYDQGQKWVKSLLARNRAVLDALAAALQAEQALSSGQVRTVALSAGGVVREPMPRWPSRPTGRTPLPPR